MKLIKILSLILVAIVLNYNSIAFGKLYHCPSPDHMIWTVEKYNPDRWSVKIHGDLDWKNKGLTLILSKGQNNPEAGDPTEWKADPIPFEDASIIHCYYPPAIAPDGQPVYAANKLLEFTQRVAGSCLQIRKKGKEIDLFSCTSR